MIRINIRIHVRINSGIILVESVKLGNKASVR